MKLQKGAFPEIRIGKRTGFSLSDIEKIEIRLAPEQALPWKVFFVARYQRLFHDPFTCQFDMMINAISFAKEKTSKKVLPVYVSIGGKNDKD